MAEKHALPRDKKARKSEQDKYGRGGKSTHFLEMRKQEKVSKTDRAMGEKHTLSRDEKARKSEQDKYGQGGKSTHFLETRKQEKVSKTDMGNGGKARTL
jgi:predicted transcriptional regulator